MSPSKFDVLNTKGVVLLKIIGFVRAMLIMRFVEATENRYPIERVVGCPQFSTQVTDETTIPAGTLKSKFDAFGVVKTNVNV